MGRPLKTDVDRRTLKIEVRVNLAEKTRIEQNAGDAGQEPSVYLRSLGTGHKPTRTVPTPDREGLLKLLAEAGKQGSNLNQIARAINRQQSEDDGLDGIDGNLVNHVMRENRALQAMLMQFLTI